jgi:hypothetical protein
MRRQAVVSSNLASVGYDAATQTLEIEFHHGGVYQYFDVPQAAHDGLMNAGSKGRYFDTNIKGVYRYARV